MGKLYKVSFDEHAGIVIVQLTGEATHEDHSAARDDAVQLCLEKKCSKLLVDLRDLVTNLSSTLSCFSFGELLAKISPLLYIAHVLPTDAKSVKDVIFTSNVEANRGLLTREFSNVDEARHWLLQR